MDFESDQAAHRTRPFPPFSIHIGSGESFRVRHPETIASSSDVPVVVVIPGPGRFAMIDLADNTEITQDFDPSPDDAKA